MRRKRSFPLRGIIHENLGVRRLRFSVILGRHRRTPYG